MLLVICELLCGTLRNPGKLNKQEPNQANARWLVITYHQYTRSTKMEEVVSSQPSAARLCAVRTPEHSLVYFAALPSAYVRCQFCKYTVQKCRLGCVTVSEFTCPNRYIFARLCCRTRAQYANCVHEKRLLPAAAYARTLSSCQVME